MSPVIKEPRSCAYCGSPGPLSREHIIPKFIFNRHYQTSQERPLTNIITRTGPSATPAEPTIADVCSKCNGGFLSALDEYASGLYDDYFAHSFERGIKIRAEFDFVRLSRWLIKLAFNVGRSRNWPVALIEKLRQFVPFIRGTPGAIPEFWVSLHVLSPISSKELKKLNSLEHLSTEQLESIRRPDFRRVAHWRSEYGEGILVGMNAFQFRLCFPSPLKRSAWIKASHQLLRFAPASAWLEPGKSHVVIYPSSWTFLDELERSNPLQRNIQVAVNRIRK